MVGRQMDDSLCLFYLEPVRLFMSHPVKRASTGLSECQRGGTLLLWHLIVNARTKNNDFFWSVLDCKKQNEFQYNSGQLMEWLSGIADIKR